MNEGEKLTLHIPDLATGKSATITSDATEHLLDSPANAERLREAIEQMESAPDGSWALPTAHATAAAQASYDRMEEALHRIAGWADAYPLSVFPEPDAAYYAKAAEVLKANGMTLDRLSAAAMRHVITQVGDIAKGALTDER